MALRQLMLAKQIADKEKELEEIRGKDADFETREKELETSIEEANTEEERSVVDEEITKFTEEKEAHEERKSELETELGELRGKMKEYEKAPEKREKEKDMGKRSEEIEEASFDERTELVSVHYVDGRFHSADRYIAVIRNGRTCACLTFLRCDDDNAIGSTRTVDGGSRSIFQYGKAFNIIRIDHRQRISQTFHPLIIHCQTVDYNQRVVFCSQ